MNPKWLDLAIKELGYSEDTKQITLKLYNVAGKELKAEYLDQWGPLVFATCFWIASKFSETYALSLDCIFKSALNCLWGMNQGSYNLLSKGVGD